MIKRIQISWAQKEKLKYTATIMYLFFKDFYIDLTDKNADVDWGQDKRKKRPIRYYIVHKIQARYPCVEVVYCILKEAFCIITAKYERVEDQKLVEKVIRFKAEIPKTLFKKGDLITIDRVNEEKVEEDTVDSIYESIENNRDKIRKFKIAAETPYRTRDGKLNLYVWWVWDKRFFRFPTSYQSLPSTDGTKHVDIDLKNVYAYYVSLEEAKRFDDVRKDKVKSEILLQRCFDSKNDYDITDADQAFLKFPVNLDLIKRKVLNQKRKVYRFYQLKEELKQKNMDDTFMSLSHIVEFYYLLQCIAQKIKERLEQDTKIITVNYTGNGFSVLCKYDEKIIEKWEGNYLIDRAANQKRRAQRLIGCPNLYSNKPIMQAVVPVLGELCGMKFPRYDVFAVSNPCFFMIKSDMRITTKYGKERVMFSRKREDRGTEVGYIDQGFPLLIPGSKFAVSRTEWYTKEITGERKTIEQFLDENNSAGYFRALAEYLETWMVPKEELLKVVFPKIKIDEMSK